MSAKERGNDEGGIMKRRTYWKNILFSVVTILVLAGCAGPTAYHRGDLFGGYADKNEGLGAYAVSFTAQNRPYEFARRCAYYHAAEVSLYNGFHFFSVVKEDEPSNSANATQESLAKGRDREVQTAVIHIQCYAQRPAGTCYDAYQCLDQVKVPGAENYYTVAQRQVDMAVSQLKNKPAF
jgi:hypothetical protein